MTPQIPAEGIYKTGEWGDSVSYRIACNCHDANHSHDLWVEASDIGIDNTIYTTVKSKWWSINRLKQIWILLTKGYIETESSISLTTQQALNYSEVLKSSIEYVDKLRESYIRKKKDE